jgi:TetR/AcrR family transcriptional regulator, tetracycline repressor protein
MAQPSATPGRSPRLSRDRIVATVVDLLESGGVDAVTTRSVGEALQVHPTALYRHFRDMDEVIREAADRILEGLAAPTSANEAADPMGAVQVLCLRLRTALMSHPGAAGGVASGPSRMPHERILTERMLDLLSQAGLSDHDVVMAYHALIELTVGSAAIDPPRLGDEQDEDARHRAWRADYLAAPPDDFPVTSRVAPLLYPDQDSQFRYGLQALVDGIRRKVAARSA